MATSSSQLFTNWEAKYSFYKIYLYTNIRAVFIVHKMWYILVKLRDISNIFHHSIGNSFAKTLLKNKAK